MAAPAKTKPPHGLRLWATEPVVVTRAKVVVLAWLLGLILGGLVYVTVKEFDHAADQREALERRDKQLAALIAGQRAALERIKALESPTDAELRRRLARALRALTPGQARRILHRALHDLTPQQRRQLLRDLEGGDEPRGGNPPPGPPRPSPGAS